MAPARGRWRPRGRRDARRHAVTTGLQTKRSPLDVAGFVFWLVGVTSFLLWAFATYAALQNAPDAPDATHTFLYEDYRRHFLTEGQGLLLRALGWSFFVCIGLGALLLGASTLFGKLRDCGSQL
jgi:hypothetical protein